MARPRETRFDGLDGPDSHPPYLIEVRMKRMVVLRAFPLACGLVLTLAAQSPEAFAASWATGAEAILPANAGSDPHVFPYSLSCPSAGNCSAVGTYADSSGHAQGLLLTETAGTWAAGVDAVLPANAGSNPDVGLNAVSCASAGNCTAVGSYTDTSGFRRGLVLTETGGTWATGVEASLPGNAASNPKVSIGSVSCASAGNCSAVGNYEDSSGHTQG